jgi:hypothetical protein
VARRQGAAADGARRGTAAAATGYSMQEVGVYDEARDSADAMGEVSE